MKTNGIHLFLITGLAVALGFSLASTPAVGYPTAAISYGANPLWATGGEVGIGSTVTVFSAPATHDAVVTDIAIDVDNYASVWLKLSDGTVVGRHRILDSVGHVDRSLVSGINIPAGQSLQMQHDWGYPVYYSVSGYYAQQ